LDETRYFFSARLAESSMYFTERRDNSGSTSTHCQPGAMGPRDAAHDRRSVCCMMRVFFKKVDFLFCPGRGGLSSEMHWIRRVVAAKRGTGCPIRLDLFFSPP
jgi:hypothetical protein